MRDVSLEEARTVVAPLGDPERLPGFSWSLPNLVACAEADTVCLHRGESFADDWVREVWIVARAWLPAARRVATHLFAGGARQLRWQMARPVDPRVERVWGRYGARTIAVGKETLTVGLDDPSLPRGPEEPSLRRVVLGRGVSFGLVTFGELDRIAALFQRPVMHEALGYWRGATLAELIPRLLPEVPRYHGINRMHVYAVRKNGVPVGAVIEHGRSYDSDSVREIDMMLEEGALPVRTWAQLAATVVDQCFRQGATRMVVNVRDRLANLSKIFGGDDATAWSAESAAPTRTFYSSTAAQFYGSPGARMYIARSIRQTMV